MKKKKLISLISRQALGGIHGGKGYNFQDDYIVSRIPYWLAKPSFTRLLKEGVGDIDVLFVCGGLDNRYSCQVKDHPVFLNEFRNVLEQFKSVDENTPETFKQFWLACPGLEQKVNSFRGALERYREASKMFDKERNIIIVNTRAELEEKIAEFNLPVSLNFAIEKLFFDTDLAGLTNNVHLCDQFIGALLKIPKWTDASRDALEDAYRNLALHINKAIGQTISRKEIEDIIRSSVEKHSPVPKSKKAIVIYLHNWAVQKFDLEPDYTLDWSEHFDRAVRKAPDPETWSSVLLPELLKIRNEVDKHTNKRFIRFRGRACLSAGLAFGYTFPEVAGYGIEAEQRNQVWRSDYKQNRHAALDFEHSLENSDSSDLRVEFSVTANVSRRVREYIKATGAYFKASLKLRPSSDIGPDSVPDGATALKYVREAKRIIREVRDLYEAERVHLFLSGPLGIAVFLGQQLNALGEVQCYEEQSKGYVKSCLLRT